MKTTNVISGVILLFVALVITSCEDFKSPEAPTKATSHDVAIWVDNTDSTTKSREPLISGFMEKVMGTSYGNVTFSYITDVSMNETATVSFKEPTDTENDYFLKQAIDDSKASFMEEFGTASKKFLAPSNGTRSSSVYVAIQTALKNLSDSKAEKKTLIVVSDMIENSRCLNLYKYKGSPEQAGMDMSNCEGPLPEAKDVEVIILFRAENAKHDEQFTRAMKMWKSLFDNYGIHFTTAANI